MKRGGGGGGGRGQESTHPLAYSNPYCVHRLTIACARKLNVKVKNLFSLLVQLNLWAQCESSF